MKRFKIAANYISNTPTPDECEAIESLYSSNKQGIYLTEKNLERYQNIKIFSKNPEQTDYWQDSNAEILNLQKGGYGNIIIRTGQYAGFISNGNFELQIGSGYSNSFLFRMLNVINNIFVDKDTVYHLNTNNEDQSGTIFEYLFLTSLNKALINGFPLSYSIRHNTLPTIKGRIDFSNYIKKGINHPNKLPLIYSEQTYVEEIANVIYVALNHIKHLNLRNFPELKLFRADLANIVSTPTVNTVTISKAKKHKALTNPIYAEYRKVIEYAEKVIYLNCGFSSDQAKGKKQNLFGFLININELWELYLERILKAWLEDWNVYAQHEIEVFEGSFFRRTWRPDFVLQNKNTGNYAVLDAKFKKMDFSGFDVDRNDLYQISYYGSHFSQFNTNKRINCALIYPLSEDLRRDNDRRDNDRRDNVAHFCGEGFNLAVTGIYVGKKDSNFSEIKSQRKSDKKDVSSEEKIIFSTKEARFVEDLAAFINK